MATNSTTNTATPPVTTTTFSLAVADTVFVRNSDGTIVLSSNPKYLTSQGADLGATDKMTGTDGGLTFRVSKIGRNYNMHKATEGKMRSHNGTISIGFTEADGGSDLTTVVVTSYFTLKDSPAYVTSKLGGRSRPNVKNATRSYSLSEADRTSRIVTVLLPHVYAERDSFITYEAEVINATNNNSPTSNCIKISNDIRVNFTPSAQGGNVLTGASVDQANTISVSTRPQFYVQTGLEPTDQIYATIFARKIGSPLDPFYATGSLNNGLRTDGKDTLYNTARNFTFSTIRNLPPQKTGLVGTFTGENADVVGTPTLREITFTVPATNFSFAERTVDYFKDRIIISTSTTQKLSSAGTEIFTIFSSSLSANDTLLTFKYRYIKGTDSFAPTAPTTTTSTQVTFNIEDAGLVGTFTGSNNNVDSDANREITFNVPAVNFSAREKVADFFKGRVIIPASSSNKLSTAGTEVYTITSSVVSTNNTNVTFKYKYTKDATTLFNPSSNDQVNFIITGGIDRNLRFEPIVPYTVYECVLVTTKEVFPQDSLLTLPNFRTSVISSQSQNSNIVRGFSFASLTETQRGVFSGSINVVTLLTGANAGALAVGGIGYTARTAISPKHQLASLFSVKNSVRTLIKNKFLSISTAANVDDFSGVVTNPLRSNNDILTIPKSIVDAADNQTSFVLEMCELRALKDSHLNESSGVPQLKDSINVIQYSGDYFQRFPNCATIQFSKPVDRALIGQPISAVLNAIRSADGSTISFGLSMQHQIPTFDKTVVLSNMLIELSDSEAFDDPTQTTTRANEDSLFITRTPTVASASKVLTVPIVGNNPEEFLRIYVMDGSNSLVAKALEDCKYLRARITYQASQVGYINNTTSSTNYVTNPLNVDNAPDVPSVSNLTAFASVVQGVRTITGSHNIPVVPVIAPSTSPKYLYARTILTLLDESGKEVDRQTIQNATNSATVVFKFELSDSIPSGSFTVTAVPEYFQGSNGPTVSGGLNAVSVGFLTQVKLSSSAITTSAALGSNQVSGKGLNNGIGLRITVTMTPESANNVARVLVAIPNASTNPCLDAARDGVSNNWVVDFNAVAGADYSNVKPFIIVFGVPNAGFTTSDSLR
jgi:hypothetical protein